MPRRNRIDPIGMNRLTKLSTERKHSVEEQLAHIYDRCICDHYRDEHWNRETATFEGVCGRYEGRPCGCPKFNLKTKYDAKQADKKWKEKNWVMTKAKTLAKEPEMKRDGFYVEISEAVDDTIALFYGFQSGQHDSIHTQRGALSFAEFLEQMAKRIRQDNKKIRRVE